jgi:hypothetical protein
VLTRRDILQSAAAMAVPVPDRAYVVVMPGTHPGIAFSEQELPALRERAKGPGMAGEAWRRIKEAALAGTPARLTPREAVGAEGRALARKLEAMALVWQVERDERMGREAAAIFRSTATGIEPREFFKTVHEDFFATEHWPKAFGFAWDWLFHLMPREERSVILEALERWNAALFEHTESWWWRDASYNCGAIPVGAQGVLLTAIQAETKHPEFGKWFGECFRKIRDNYFPGTWREDGICNEGPGYAHYHRNPTRFAEAVRRTGGPDIIPRSGAVNAMHYLRHQWMPQGGCAPVGDNTGYGRRVFQSIYLHGIRELRDRAGLWTYRQYADRERTEQTELFLFYPDGLDPAPPGGLDLPVSHYFEIDRWRAGTVFARSGWDGEQAHWFAFVTRYANANHTHYDMNSFLFTAFGEPFATHDNIWGYSHEHHGVDFEHNMVIMDQGGMPAADRPTSAGDDGSIGGFLTGVGLGNFADYVRGDARQSYADRSVRGSAPAVRANRSAVFVKQGPSPYIVVGDDIQKDAAEHDYHWQWYTEARAISGRGSFEAPFVIEGRNANCAIAFFGPAAPEHEFRLVSSPDARRKVELGLLRVSRRGVRARFVAAAVAWRKGGRRPVLRRGPEAAGHPDAALLIVEGDGFRDLILWQPEDPGAGHGRMIEGGGLRTDALLAVVRTDLAGAITGYAMGDGTALESGGVTLARSRRPLSVIADARRAMAAGPRRARQGLEPLPAAGSFRLPAAGAEVWVDGRRVRPARAVDGMVTAGA